MGLGQSTDSSINPEPLSRKQLLEYREVHRGRLVEFMEKLDKRFARTCKKVSVMLAKRQREECELDEWEIEYDDLIDEEDISLLPLCQSEIVQFGERIKEALSDGLPDYEITPSLDAEGDLHVLFHLRPLEESESSTST